MARTGNPPEHACAQARRRGFANGNKRIARDEIPGLVKFVLWFSSPLVSP